MFNQEQGQSFNFRTNKREKNAWKSIAIYSEIYFYDIISELPQLKFEFICFPYMKNKKNTYFFDTQLSMCPSFAKVMSQTLSSLSSFQKQWFSYLEWFTKDAKNVYWKGEMMTKLWTHKSASKLFY